MANPNPKLYCELCEKEHEIFCENWKNHPAGMGRRGLTLAPQTNWLREFAGTFVFTFVVFFSQIMTSFLKDVGVPYYLNLYITSSVIAGYALAMVIASTGGHINPAVSIAKAIETRSARLLSYVPFQLAGAILACFLLREFFVLFGNFVPSIKDPYIVHVSTPTLYGLTQKGSNILEFVGTLALVLAATTKKPAQNVGSVVLVCGLLFGPLTGALLNPALWVGPAVATWSFTGWLAYLPGQLLAAVIGGLIFLPGKLLRARLRKI